MQCALPSESSVFTVFVLNNPLTQTVCMMVLKTQQATREVMQRHIRHDHQVQCSPWNCCCWSFSGHDSAGLFLFTLPFCSVPNPPDFSSHRQSNLPHLTKLSILRDSAIQQSRVPFGAGPSLLEEPLEWYVQVDLSWSTPHLLSHTHPAIAKAVFSDEE